MFRFQPGADMKRDMRSRIRSVGDRPRAGVHRDRTRPSFQERTSDALYTKSTQNMSETESPPEKTTVNIRMTETFLDDVDATWEEQGFNSRSEFIRAVLRDALKHPDFNRADLKAMLASESEIREGRTHSSDDLKAEYGLDGTARDSDE